MTEPKFIPKPGQIDYTNIRYAPTINCIVKYQDEFLLLQRSSDLHFYPGYWNGLSGFLDDHKDIEDKVKEELWEELGITSDKVIFIKIAQPIYRDEKEYDKTWIVFPILVEVSTQELKTDFEHSGFKWFKINEISDMLNNYKIIPDIKDILGIFFNK